MSDDDRSLADGRPPRPDGDERPPFVIADERTTLLAALDHLRASVLKKAGGLPDADLRRPMVGSGTNLLGLVAHLTAAELFWFAHTFAGADDHVPPNHFTVPDGVGADEVLGGYRRATARSDEVVAAAPEIDTPCARTYRGGDTRLTLRWVLVHMIEETARHAGHADILREQLDGRTGR